MQTYFIIFHVILSVLLVTIILLQGGSDELKGLSSSNMDSVMSSGSSANLMTKITGVLAVLFIVNCLILANLATRDSRSSIVDKIETKQEQPQKPRVDAPMAK